MENMLIWITFFLSMVIITSLLKILYQDWKDAREFSRWWEEREKNDHGK